MSQLRFAGMGGGANGPSLTEAQINFEQTGVSDPIARAAGRITVRPPDSSDRRDPGWRRIRPGEIEYAEPGIDQGSNYPSDYAQLYYWRPTYWRATRGPTRLKRGVLQNVANQLAQMAVGWQLLTNQGEKFVGQPPQGRLLLDVIEGVEYLNERIIDFGMALYLRRWLADEMSRRHLEELWLAGATVDIQYEFDGNAWARTRRAAVDLEAEVKVITMEGEATATSTNRQLLMIMEG